MPRPAAGKYFDAKTIMVYKVISGCYNPCVTVGCPLGHTPEDAEGAQ
jgi:hypothetical protein